MKYFILLLLLFAIGCTSIQPLGPSEPGPRVKKPVGQPKPCK